MLLALWRGAGCAHQASARACAGDRWRPSTLYNYLGQLHSPRSSKLCGLESAIEVVSVCLHMKQGARETNAHREAMLRDFGMCVQQCASAIDAVKVVRDLKSRQQYVV